MRIGPVVSSDDLREVIFEERVIEELQFHYPRRSFERVSDISKIAEWVYASLWSPGRLGFGRNRLFGRRPKN